MKLILLILVSSYLPRSALGKSYCSCRNMFKPPSNVPETVPETENIIEARILLGETVQAADLQYLAALFTETFRECDFTNGTGSEPDNPCSLVSWESGQTPGKMTLPPGIVLPPGFTLPPNMKEEFGGQQKQKIVVIRVACTGTVLNERWVLTSATCVHLLEKSKENLLPGEKEAKLKMAAGLDHDLLQTSQWPLYEREIVELVQHPDAKNENKEKPTLRLALNDVGLVKASVTLLFSVSGIRPVCLLKDDLKLFEHANLIAAGFGGTESDYVKGRSMKSRALDTRPVVIQTNGHRALATNMRHYVIKRTESQPARNDIEEVKQVKLFCNADNLEQGVFCATSRTSSVCNGDRGGPLLFKKNDNNLYQSAIASVIIAKDSGDFKLNCVRFVRVAYVRVSKHLEFIRKVAGRIC